MAAPSYPEVVRVKSLEQWVNPTQPISAFLEEIYMGFLGSLIVPYCNKLHSAADLVRRTVIRSPILGDILGGDSAGWLR